MKAISCTKPAVALAASSTNVARRVPVKCSAKLPKTNTQKSTELILNSTVAPMIALAASNPFVNYLQGQADTFSTLGLPDWLVKWGHGGNMAVVLLAMGGYATYLGWQIRFATEGNLELEPAALAKARDLHPKLAIGMGAFFALGAMGGMMSLLMQGKELTHSPHFITGVTGLVLLSLQGMLSAFFEDDPNARGAHAVFGSFLMCLFAVHMVLGLQLGLSL